MSETHLQTRIRRAILQHFPGSWMVKIHGGPMQAAGIPDLIGCVEGRFVALEVKLPGGKHPVSPLQTQVLRQIKRAGGVARVVTSEEDALSILSESYAPSQVAQTR